MLANMSKTNDLIFYRNQKIISKLISDNYMVLIIYIVVILFCIAVLYYFGNSIYKTIRNYYKYSKTIEVSPSQTDNQYDVGADDEVYQKLEESIDKKRGFYKFDVRNDSEEHIRQTKREFIEDIKKRYEEYNKLKSDYILTTYNKQNDDIIDQNILYDKHDDYSYKKLESNN